MFMIFVYLSQIYKFVLECYLCKDIMGSILVLKFPFISLLF